MLGAAAGRKSRVESPVLADREADAMMTLYEGQLAVSKE